MVESLDLERSFHSLSRRRARGLSRLRMPAQNGIGCTSRIPI